MPFVLQSLFWKGRCYICGGVLSDAVAVAKGMRRLCPFGGEKQQRQEACEILSAEQGTPCSPCCSGGVLTGRISLPGPLQLTEGLCA